MEPALVKVEIDPGLLLITPSELPVIDPELVTSKAVDTLLSQVVIRVETGV